MPENSPAIEEWYLLVELSNHLPYIVLDDGLVYQSDVFAIPGREGGGMSRCFVGQVFGSEH